MRLIEALRPALVTAMTWLLAIAAHLGFTTGGACLRYALTTSLPLCSRLIPMTRVLRAIVTV